MTIDKAKLKALAEAATQGERMAEKCAAGIPHVITDEWDLAEVHVTTGANPMADAEFMAAASPATVLALLAEIERLEKFEDWFVRLDQVEQTLSASFKAERDQLKAENEALRKDAKRYRFLRNQHWPVAELAVVCNPKVSVKLGHDCPSGDRLDQQVDGAMIRGASHD
jgi:hypothetical protein